MAHYRTRPMTFEAHCFKLDGTEPEWLKAALGDRKGWRQGWSNNIPYVMATTPEGPMRVNFGDWIIRGVNGKLAVCKPDIFEATFERVQVEEVKAAE